MYNTLQRKADELSREVDHWKSVAHHSKQIETKAQDELSVANQRIFELQRLLNEKSVEISTINEQKSLLQSQVNSRFVPREARN
jgi:hypothetical protein